MTLTPVKSSHIATIDYIASHRVLLVGYGDGSLYAQREFSPQEFAALQSAESKGRWIYCRDRKGIDPILIAKGGTHAGDPVTPDGGNAAPMTTTVDSTSVEQNSKGGAGGEVTAAPLNVLDEDADKCCRAGFAKSDMTWRMSNACTAVFFWNCSECGTEFRPDMVGASRYWRIVPAFGIVRPK